MGQEQDRIGVGRIAAIVVILVLVGWALHATRSVSVLVAAGVLVAVVLAPADAWLARRLPEKLSWLAHVGATLIAVAGLAVFAAGLGLAAQQLAAAFPAPPGGEEASGASAAEGASAGEGGAAGEGVAAAAGEGGAAAGEGASAGGQGMEMPGMLEWLRDRLDEFGVSLGGQAASTAGTVAQTVASSALATVAGLVLVIFLVLLLLMERREWRARLAGAIPGWSEAELSDAAGTLALRLRQYLWVRLAVGIMTALLYVGWLWLFGVDLLFVWAILTVLLNFIPNVGSLLSGILPTVYALLTRDFGTAVWVAVGLVAIEQVMGNYVDPRMQGGKVELSATVIFVSLLFWSWIWGIPGALLATPMTLAVYLFCAKIEPLRPVALLLGDRTDEEGTVRAAEA